MLKLFLNSPGHNSGVLRKRRTSERSAEEGSTEKEDIKEEKKRRKSVNTTLRGNKYFTFDVEKVNSAETVFKYVLRIVFLIFVTEVL